jgi:hypothetical protein
MAMRRIDVRRDSEGLLLATRSEEVALEAFFLACLFLVWCVITGACIHDLVTLGGIRIRGGGLATSVASIAGIALVQFGLGAAVMGPLLWKVGGREILRVTTGRLRHEVLVAGLKIRNRECDLTGLTKVDYAVLPRAGTVVQIHMRGRASPWGFAYGASTDEAVRAVKELRALLPRDS